MPIYEFYCPDNHKIYSFFARSLSLSGSTPRCPDNPQWKMERLVSKFAVIGRAKEKPETPEAGGMDDPRMEAAMAEMEREFSSMDDNNPDPRQLARVIRKMTHLAGEKVPPEMDEMIRRLEAGEDPEELEERFGDAFDKFESAEGDPPAAGEGETTVKSRLRRLRKPTRDPVLYEMSEYVN